MYGSIDVFMKPSTMSVVSLVSLVFSCTDRTEWCLLYTA